MFQICFLFPVTAHADVKNGTFNGHKYRIISNGLSGFEAERFCESLGGYLAIIDSEEENAFLFDFCQYHGYDSVFFGITDEKAEGNWKTVKGDSLKYTNWADGEPNGETEENWAMFYWGFSDGKWNDGTFDYPYLCEWDDVTSTQGSYNGHTYEIFDNLFYLGRSGSIL